MTETDGEYKARVLREGVEANNLLNHHMIRDFFEEETTTAIQAFRQSKSTDDQAHMATHSYLAALERLESSLRRKVTAMEDMRVRDEINNTGYETQGEDDGEA